MKNKLGGPNRLIFVNPNRKIQVVTTLASMNFRLICYLQPIPELIGRTRQFRVAGRCIKTLDKCAKDIEILVMIMNYEVCSKLDVHQVAVIGYTLIGQSQKSMLMPFVFHFRKLVCQVIRRSFRRVI